VQKTNVATYLSLPVPSSWASRKALASRGLLLLWHSLVGWHPIRCRRKKHVSYAKNSTHTFPHVGSSSHSFWKSPSVLEVHCAAFLIKIGKKEKKRMLVNPKKSKMMPHNFTPFVTSLPSSPGLQKSPWLPEVHQCVGVVTHFWVCLIKIGREVEERRMLVIKNQQWCHISSPVPSFLCFWKSPPASSSALVCNMLPGGG